MEQERLKLIAGLGNPGARYERTRHNVGFLVVDRLLARHAPDATPRARFHALTVDTHVAGRRCLFLKPMTYMNRSGLAVAEAVRFFRLLPAEDLLVIVDDVALPLGTIRLRPGGGDGGHNGLADIHRALNTDAYPRLRVGIGAPGAQGAQVDFVLGRISDEEWTRLSPALDRAADAVEAVLASGLDCAMNRFNAPVRHPGSDAPVDPGWLDRTLES